MNRAFWWRVLDAATGYKLSLRNANHAIQVWLDENDDADVPGDLLHLLARLDDAMRRI